MLTFAMPLRAFSADVVSIWGGARGTVVKKSDGTVWTWGANFGGKPGIGIAMTNLNRVLVPTEVHGAGDVGFLNSVTAIMGGEVHNIALKSDGTVCGWGNNFFGQVSNGTTNDVYTPDCGGIHQTDDLYRHGGAISRSVSKFSGSVPTPTPDRSVGFNRQRVITSSTECNDRTQPAGLHRVVQTTLHGVVNVCGCVTRQAVADGDVVPTGNDHQTISQEL